MILIDHLSASEVRLLSIALNRLGETGEWNTEALTSELNELIDLDEDVFVTGFEKAEIDLLLLGEVDDRDQSDAVPKIEEQAVSRPDDVWILGAHRLLQGDALEPENYARLLAPGEQARIVLTDVPYNVPVAGHITGRRDVREFAMASGEMSRDEFVAFNHGWMKAVSGSVLDGGILATFIDWRSVEIILAAGRELGLNLLNVVVWAKSNAGQGSLWRSQHEMLPIFKLGTAPHVNHIQLGRFGRWRSNVWEYAGAAGFGSEARKSLRLPTVKPTAMLVDALLDVTNRSDIVIDPFAGSGSTLIAAERTGRQARLIEIDGLYCDVIIRRWQELTGQDAVLEETGETFERVQDRRLSGEGV